MEKPATPIALEDRQENGDRLFSPSAARNRQPVLEAFEASGFTDGRVLEIGSGTGEQAIALLQHFPGLSWIASDPDPLSRKSCAAWAEHAGVSDRMRVLDLNLLQSDWHVGLGSIDLIYCSNVIHIAPIGVLNALMTSAPDLLGDTGRLALYGPFMRNGEQTAPSNEAFDQSLKSRNPDWGVRDLERDVVPLAERSRMKIADITEMPANNLFVVFERN